MKGRGVVEEKDIWGVGGYCTTMANLLREMVDYDFLTICSRSPLAVLASTKLLLVLSWFVGFCGSINNRSY
jgi:hypothetical protein